MRLLTQEDIRDVFVKGIQRGLPFILSKFNFSSLERTKSAFNTTASVGSNWWDIPYVKRRWNEKISGDLEVDYETYLTKTVFSNSQHLKLVSIGSGICSHEMRLAELNPNWEIHCVDIADNLLQKAAEISREKGLNNMQFLHQDIYQSDLQKEFYDVVLFHSSLHHFDDIEHFLKNKIMPVLKENGKLIINEFVGKNRLQFDKEQIKAINQCIKLIDEEYRVIYKTNLLKNKFYGSGLLRMIIADPSECIDSESIMPNIHQHFNTIVEKPYGGNLLMSALKSIAHHFIELDARKQDLLDQLFAFEDEYLKSHQSDFVFGVYEKKTL